MNSLAINSLAISVECGEGLEILQLTMEQIVLTADLKQRIQEGDITVDVVKQ